MDTNTWGETPLRPKPELWAALLENYTNSPGGPWPHGVLVPVLRHIIDHGYAERLYGLSHWDGLSVTNYPNMMRGKEELLIRPMPPRSSVRFEYSAEPFTPNEFAREYAPELIIEKFDSFVRMVRW